MQVELVWWQKKLICLHGKALLHCPVLVTTKSDVSLQVEGAVGKGIRTGNPRTAWLESFRADAHIYINAYNC